MRFTMDRATPFATCATAQHGLPCGSKDPERGLSPERVTSWDGPAPDAAIDAWQTSGGMALAVTAAALWPTEAPRQGSAWSGAQRVRMDVSGLPASYTFSGSGIAVVGTLGDSCGEPGRAALHVDGAEPTDHTGIWQNKSPAGESFPGAVLFAWRWPTAGPHRLDFLPDAPNAKEGGPFLHATGYVVLP